MIEKDFNDKLNDTQSKLKTLDALRIVCKENFSADIDALFSKHREMDKDINAMKTSIATIKSQLKTMLDSIDRINKWLLSVPVQIAVAVALVYFKKGA